MKTLEWNPRHYLGKEMYAQWQDALATEETRSLAREKRREVRQMRKERRLQRKLQEEVIRGKQVEKGSLVRRRSSTKSRNTGTTPNLQQGSSELTDKDGVRIAFKRSHTADNIDPGTPPEDDRRISLLRTNSGRRIQLPSLSKAPGSPKRERLSLPASSLASAPASAHASRKPRQLKLLTRLGMRRPLSTDKLSELGQKGEGVKDANGKAGLPLSPSMPMIAQAASLLDTRAPPDSPSSTVNNPNESVFIDMPPSPGTPALAEPGNISTYNSEDEEKGNLEENELGIVI